MPITRTEVEKIAKLANLELTDAEKESFSGQLAAIVEYIDQLNEVDTVAVNAWQPRSAGEAVGSYASRADLVEPDVDDLGGTAGKCRGSLIDLALLGVCHGVRAYFRMAGSG